MRRSALVWATVITASLLVAHAYGYSFAVGNQVTYFLHALQHAHPELFRHDWLVSSTNEYHSVFGFFAGLLFEIDDSGAVVFAIVHVVLMVALLCGLFLLVTERPCSWSRRPSDRWTSVGADGASIG